MRKLIALIVFAAALSGCARNGGGGGYYAPPNPYLQPQSYSIINPNGTMTTCQGMGGQLTCF